MPATTNYAWVYPTEGGDIGTWDTILNTLFVDADADVKAVEEIAVKDLTETNSKMHIPHSGGSQYWFGGTSGVFESAAVNVLGDALMIPLDVRVGQKINSFSSRGLVNGSRACTVSLWYMDNAAGVTQVNAGHSLPGAEATTTTSSVNHTVVTDRQYFLKLTPSGGSGSDGAIVKFFKINVVTV